MMGSASRRRNASRGALWLAGWLLLGGAVSAAEVGPAHPDFSGSWELNEERSDDPRERVDEALRGYLEPSRPTRGRSGASAPDGRQSYRDLVERLVGAPRVVTVSHADPEFRIESALPDRPFLRIAYTDGRQFQWAGVSDAATAGWQRGGRLVIELEVAPHHRVKETWELVAEGSRVLVATEIAGKRASPTVRVQRVYDRVEIVPWAVPD